MPTETLADGTEITWTGQGVCYCVKCKQVFNSVAAFDAHIKGKNRKHDTSGMARNSKGYLVTQLMPERKKEDNGLPF